jgi:hypothetical protein
MKEKLRSAAILCLTIAVIMMASKRMPADTSTCSGVMTTLPFTDVMNNIFFCQIAEAYISGLTNGTTPATYNPSDAVLRDQMAAFVSRTQDSALRRGSRRAALKQWASPSALPTTSRTIVGTSPQFVESDGLDVWVSDNDSNVQRVRASDGNVLGTWTAAFGAKGLLVARGRIYVAGDQNPGKLYVINPSQAPGAVGTVSSSLGLFPYTIATDGTYVWSANIGTPASVSRVDPESSSTTNFTAGFSNPIGILFDGANIWVTDHGDNSLKKLDVAGNILQSVPVGSGPEFPLFDGSNIWVPNAFSNSVTVVRARDGQVLTTLINNGLDFPVQAAFDGQRILVTNNGGSSVSLWKAADLTPLGSFAGPATYPYGACSDGINFWITLQGSSQLARF